MRHKTSKAANNSQSTKILGKINGSFRFLYRKQNFLDSSLRRLLANALIQPHFDYASSAWFTMYGLYRLKQVRKVLTDEATETIAVGIVISHLDYAKVTLMGLPQHEINRLQRGHVLTARAVLGRKAHESSTRCLKQLHWLSIHISTENKVPTLSFKALKGTARQYLKDMLKISKSVRLLTSNNMYMKLDIPKVKRE